MPRQPARAPERVQVVPDDPHGAARASWRPQPNAPTTADSCATATGAGSPVPTAGALLGPAWTRELIAEVARQHQVLLTPDDPIFLTVTLHERTVGRLVGEAEQRIGAMLDDAATRTILAAEEEREAARATAETLVTGAARYLVEQAEHAADELASRLRETLQADVAAAHAAAREAQATAHAARRLWHATISVAGLASVLLIVLLVLLLRS